MSAGAPRSAYIVGAAYDWLFFLLTPSLALGLGWVISGSWFSEAPVTLLEGNFTWAGIVLGTCIHAHLVAVLVRSHANPKVRRRHPARFLVVPPLLWLAIIASSWTAVAASVVAIFWDVWHSAAQTFGFARAYDRNRGNPAQVGRRLDFWLNQLLYAGPILAGATMLDHFQHLEGFAETGPAALAAVPGFMAQTQPWWTAAVLAAGLGYIVCYLLAYLRLHRAGYRVSWLKVFLLATTGLCSLLAWGFNSFGEAFFIMNLFHAVQYLALVWATERQRLMSMMRLDVGRHGAVVACAIFLAAVLGYGFAVQFVGDSGALWALTVTVSLLHFWYDGFIWSVRRGELSRSVGADTRDCGCLNANG